MRTVFLLFSFSILLLVELFFGKLGIFFPLVWFGCCYFGTRERFFPAVLSGLFFGALDWGLCGRDVLSGMLIGFAFAFLGKVLEDWRDTGIFYICSGVLIFCAGCSGALWIASGMRHALGQEWGLLTAQTVFWIFAGVPTAAVLCGILNWASGRLGIASEPRRRKGISSWRA